MSWKKNVFLTFSSSIRQEITNSDEDVEKKEYLGPIGRNRNVNWYSHYGKQYGGSLEN